MDSCFCSWIISGGVVGIMGCLKRGFIYGGYLRETDSFWRTACCFCSWIISGGINGLFKMGIYYLGWEYFGKLDSG